MLDMPTTSLVVSPMIGMPQGFEWLIILAVVVLVFGAAKLPDLARGTGQALRIFKAETKALRDDDESTEDRPAEPVVVADVPLSPDVPSVVADPAPPRRIHPDA